MLSRLGVQRAHITRCLIVLTMILTALLATGTDVVNAQTPPTAAEGIVPGEILVKFNPGTSETKKKDVHRRSPQEEGRPDRRSHT